jgi:broad specificity phosphatase PhoE
MTVYLVRHATAGTRDHADPKDHERHLDEHGLRQARLLTELLADADITWIASSPAPRCTETVEPLASKRSLDVKPRQALHESSDIDDAWELLEKAARRTGDVVLCSHGDIIPDLIRRAQLRGMHVPGKSGCSKGSVWALEWDTDRFVHGVYTPVKP